MVEDIIVKIALVFRVKVVKKFIVEFALTEGVFHLLDVCEISSLDTMCVLPYGHIEGVNRQNAFTCCSM
jgi:hypothetical protein